MITEKETFLLPTGVSVDFYPETHQYFVDDKELPSITTLLSKVYGNPYANVNPEVLKRAADYGTAVHNELQELIEMRKESPDIPLSFSYQETSNYFTFVEEIYKIKPILTEKVIVLYDDNHIPVSAGRFDLLCTVNNELTLADFKTTSTIHRQLVTAQLNLYARGAVQSGYISDQEKLKLGVIHLAGEKGRFIPVANLGESFYSKFLNIDKN